MHMDADSMAGIQQGGVFIVKINRWELFLEGQNYCFFYKRDKNNKISWHCGGRYTDISHPTCFFSEDLWRGKTVGSCRGIGTRIFILIRAEIHI